MSNERAASSSSEPPVAEIYRELMTVEFAGSIFPDTETLGALGILEEVQTILQDMGIQNVLTLRCAAYQQPTCMFLASLEVIYSYGVEGDANGGGFICFQNLNGGEERVTFNQLETIYGFNCQRFGSDVFENAPDEIQTLWDMIGSTKFETGWTDNSCIRHPAARYVQQILANSFFSKRNAKMVLAEDMDFLRLGLKRHIYNNLEQQPQFDNDHRGKPCPLKIFLQELLKFKQLSWTTRAGTRPQLRIGGWITPILRFAGIPLLGKVWARKLIDTEYLWRIQYLVGQAGDRFCYQFRDRYYATKTVILPNSQLTSFRRFENLFFKHGTE